MPASESSLPETVKTLPDDARDGKIWRGQAYGKSDADIVVTKPSTNGFMQWFQNLSVGRKQLAGLFTSEVISVLGLVGVGSFLIVTGGRSQLLNQARSELSVTEIAYNIKINQMGFGFRGQSDNQAIIDVAVADAADRAISESSLATVRQILRNEIEARNIEYATLVGNDLRIIASANADRVGQQFDPQGLVGTVIANPRQIKASAIVPWAELQNEQPPLPDGVEGQDALVRYTFTPVTANESDEVVGVLVSGDIVNGKSAIPQNTLEAFDTGYSAVYQRQDDGTFVLASSVDAGDNPDLEAAMANVPLADQALLERAIATPDQVVSQRDEVGDRTYTLAAEAITNFNQEPVAVLVRGVSETPLNGLIANSLKLQLLIALFALLVDVLLAGLLGRSILRPLRNLQQAAWKFGLGDRTTRADVFATDEVGRVAQIFNQLADNITESENLLKRQGQRERLNADRAMLLADMTSRIRQSLDETSILNTAVDKLRDVLNTNRVLIYRFHEDYKAGEITAESVGAGWVQAIGQRIEDPLTPEALERYNTGKVSTMRDRDQAEISHCHCDILKRLQVKANMVAPLIMGEQLIGLLCVHQCDAPRDWEAEDINLLQQTAVQIGYALAQSRLLEEQRVAAERERQLVELTARVRRFIDEDSILNTSVDGLREVLDVDRVVIYRFDADYNGGQITAESVAQGWVRAKQMVLSDPMAPDVLERYQSGMVTYREDRVKDKDAHAITHCHCEILERLQVQANIVAPLLAGDELVGLLSVHQCSGPRRWESGEINLMQRLATQIGLALSQARLLKQQALTAEKERQLNAIVSQMRETLEEERIYRTAVNETRKILATDRTVVYLFDETWKGTFVAESLESGYPSALGTDIYDPCFADNYVEQYRQGRVQATGDIQNAGLTECHLKQLAPFQVKANLVAPVVVEERLIGLLITHQCSSTRNWSPLEINFFKQVATQLGFALEQAQLFAKTQALSEERLKRQEMLQAQLVELLTDVEGASSGDLTVRANVTAGEIGTVADFFNAIVESLRQIVTKVKQSAEQVNESIGDNESSIRNLADEALRQADEVTLTLTSVETMTASIQQVAESARKAAVVASTASATAETSGEAMDLTVQNILNLRGIIGETSKKVKRLGESSQQISKVVSLINQIAMQTNLLAINAGIEAARAGEEGQGFAVVAEEVGELAARSADATQEIERIVETIQRETVEVVEAMEQSTTEVVAGTHLVEDAKQSFGRILEVSRQIDQLVQSISNATVSQVEVSETVTKLMQDIAQVSKQTSVSSRQITGSLRRTVEVAQALQESVGTFKTGD
jgi:methyl-accepting chemotaxis protein